MGVVHLGRKETGERAAIKVLRPHVVSDDEARARLAREVNSLGRVRSPRVAEIVDADPTLATHPALARAIADQVDEERAEFLDRA